MTELKPIPQTACEVQFREGHITWQVITPKPPSPARRRGRVGGRPAALSDKEKGDGRGDVKDGVLTVGKIAEGLGVSRATLYRTFPKGRAH